jgi:c-di-GMP-binding flagellar brake protein YcgR
MPRVPLRNCDLIVGQPTKWDVFDPKGTLMIARGTVVESEQVLSGLLQKRGVRELDFGAKAADMEKQTARRANESDSREVRMPFEDTRIKPGDSLQLQEANGIERLPVKLIGYQKSRSVIVTNPVQKGSPIFLREGSVFVARIFSGQLAFAFKCSMLANPTKPYPHVHLSYPAEMVGLKVRRDERVKLRAITAFDLDAGQSGSGVLTNLSSGGAQLLTRATGIVPGTGIMVKFELTLGGVEYLIELAGVVRTVVANHEEPGLGEGYGLQFAEVSPEDSLIISAFVFQQLVENKAS